MEKDILILTKNLISIPSTKDNTESLEKVLALADKYLKGFKYKKFTSKGIPSVIYYNTPSLPKRFKIILNAHLDVVPGNRNQYRALIKGDKLYGRGAQDMKTSAAVEIIIFKGLASKVNYPLGLQLVTDEEIGGFNGTKYQVKKGIMADFVIAGEPTDFGVNNKAKGIIWAKLKTKGKAAHGAYPWQGENAIIKMNNIINTIEDKYPVPQKEAWKTTINLAKVLSNNEAFNKVPDYCESWLDVRYIPEESDTIIKNIKRMLPKDAELDVILKEPSQFTEKENPYIKQLRKSIESVNHKASSLINKHGGSDIRHFNAAGCNGVTFGPIGEGLHTDNEWVSIKSLDIYFRIINNFLLSLNNK